MSTILIADDNEQVLKLLSAILEKESGWKVCGRAPNGRQAVLMAHDLKPDLIILELTMPMLDGLAAAREILKSTPEVPILLHTFHKNGSLELEAKQAGIRKIISKTESLDVLLNAIREFLRPASRLPVTPLSMNAENIEPLVAASGLDTPRGSGTRSKAD